MPLPLLLVSACLSSDNASKSDERDGDGSGGSPMIDPKGKTCTVETGAAMSMLAPLAVAEGADNGGVAVFAEPF